MLASGTSVGLVEPPDKISDPAGVSASPTVTGMAPVDEWAAIDSGASAEMVGASGALLTVKRKDDAEDCTTPPTVLVAVTVTVEVPTGSRRASA